MQLYCFFINATALSARLKRLHFRKEVEKIYSTVTGLAPLGKQNTHLIASHLRRVFAREIGPGVSISSPPWHASGNRVLLIQPASSTLISAPLFVALFSIKGFREA